MEEIVNLKNRLLAAWQQSVATVDGLMTELHNQIESRAAADSAPAVPPASDMGTGEADDGAAGSRAKRSSRK